jgi:hypothetical protein
MADVNADTIGNLLLDMEARAHRQGWDGPAVFAVLSGDPDAEAAYRRLGALLAGRAGAYAAWSVLPPQAMDGYPQHGLYRLARNLTYAKDHPASEMLVAGWGQPGFIGTAFLGEGWRGDTDPEERQGRRLADIPGSVEIRFAHAADIGGGYHVVLRERGSKPRLLDEGWTPSGSVYDSLRAITAALAGQPFTEEIGEPSMWSWEEQVWGPR